MNNRDYKQFSPNNYYHIYNRGNNKPPIFLDSQDFKFFLFRLKENLFPEQVISTGRHGRKLLPKDSFKLLCYCLMPNHFHLLIRQCADVGINSLLSKVCTGYSKYFNSKYNRIGHLFQDQFKSVRVETDEQMMWLSAYIHQNPLVAGLVDDLKDYEWSSHLEYIGSRQGTLCDKSLVLSHFSFNSTKYEKFVSENLDIMKTRKQIQYLLLG